MTLNRRFLAGAALLVGVVLVAGPGCKRPPAPPPPPPAPEVRLQVTSVSPSTVAPNAAAAARLFGSAFESGATVSFNGASSAPGQEVRVSDGNTINLTIPALPIGTYDVVVSNPGGESATLRSGLSVRVLESPCRQSSVFFGFDLHSLNGATRSTLDGHMSCYQGLSGAIKVEGHCDERGTVDYNLALGQRRANHVKKYLVNGGVAASRINTVSFGEERPADRGHNETAWSKNRRAEITAE